MKFPKLKYTVLCRIMLYLPAMSFFLWIAALAVILPGRETVPPIPMIGSFLLTAGLSLWYLFHNIVLLFSSDILFSCIRQWKRDRVEYHTNRNGKNRVQIQKTILRRCERWGKRAELMAGFTTKMDVFFRHGQSWTVFWSLIEKRVAVCSTDVLSAEQYRLLTGQARSLLSAIPDGKPHLKTGKERKAPRAYAGVVFILADAVTDEVKTLARKPLVKSEERCVLSCVVDCSAGNYYTSCIAEPYQQGMMPRPANNFAAAMIRKIVFSRHLPKENAAPQPASNITYDVEMSLWEYCRSFRKEMRGANDKMQKDRVKALRRMRSGETRIGDGVIWFKCENRLAEYGIMTDETDERLVTLIPDQVWYYQKNGALPSSMVGGSLNRRKMKKNEQEQVQKHMETKLIAEGCQIAKDGDSSACKAHERTL